MRLEELNQSQLRLAEASDFCIVVSFHSVANDALMNVKKGDCACFTEHTYLEVYDEIMADREADVAHEQTKEELSELKRTKQRQQNNDTIHELTSSVQKLSSILDAQSKDAFAMVVIEVLNSIYSNFSFSLVRVGALVLFSVIIFALFKRGKKWCF